MSEAQIPLSARVHLSHAAIETIALDAGVDLLHIKGPALLPDLRARERGSADVDVLVAPATWPASSRRCARHGWERRSGYASGSAFRHAANWFHDNWGYVDVHAHWPGPRVGPEEVFAAFSRGASSGHRPRPLPRSEPDRADPDPRPARRALARHHRRPRARLEPHHPGGPRRRPRPGGPAAGRHRLRRRYGRAGLRRRRPLGGRCGATTRRRRAAGWRVAGPLARGRDSPRTSRRGRQRPGGQPRPPAHGAGPRPFAPRAGRPPVAAVRVLSREVPRYCVAVAAEGHAVSDLGTAPGRPATVWRGRRGLARPGRPGQDAVYASALPDGPPMVLRGTAALIFLVAARGGSLDEVVAGVAEESGQPVEDDPGRRGQRSSTSWSAWACSPAADTPPVEEVAQRLSRDRSTAG